MEMMARLWRRLRWRAWDMRMRWRYRGQDDGLQCVHPHNVPPGRRRPR